MTINSKTYSIWKSIKSPNKEWGHAYQILIVFNYIWNKPYSITTWIFLWVPNCSNNSHTSLWFMLTCASPPTWRYSKRTRAPVSHRKVFVSLRVGRQVRFHDRSNRSSQVCRNDWSFMLLVRTGCGTKRATLSMFVRASTYFKGAAAPNCIPSRLIHLRTSIYKWSTHKHCGFRCRVHACTHVRRAVHRGEHPSSRFYL